MFHEDLRAAVAENTPQVNPLIANGLITTHIKQGLSYLNSVWQEVALSFPAGLKYVGCRELTPLEEFALRARRTSSRAPQIDLARCDLRMVRFDLTYNGAPLDPVHLQVPFFGTGGSFHLSGSLYQYSPILADRVISVNRNGIFVKLLQTKIIFHRVIYYFNTNNPGRSQEIMPVVWGRIWNGSLDKPTGTTKVSGHSTIAHYLFAQFGVKETFKRFASAEVAYGSRDQINESTYPRDEWVICTSANVQVGGRRRKHIEPNELHVAVRRSQYTHLVKTLIAGIFYVTDRFTYRRDYMRIDGTDRWRVMLGVLLFGRDKNEGALLSDIDGHLLSMGRYVDDIARHNLKKIGHDIDGIYELFILILNKIDTWIIEGDNTSSSLYRKEFSTLYNLYFNITSAIFHFLFELEKQQRRTGLSERHINEQLRAVLKPGLIFALKSGHGEVWVSDYVGSNMLKKSTSIMTPQHAATKGGRSSPTTDPSRKLDKSHLEVFPIAGMTKAEPMGGTRVNPFLQITEEGGIVRNARLAALVDYAGEMFSHHQLQSYQHRDSDEMDAYEVDD